MKSSESSDERLWWKLEKTLGGLQCGSPPGWQEAKEETKKKNLHRVLHCSEKNHLNDRNSPCERHSAVLLLLTSAAAAAAATSTSTLGAQQQ